MSLLRCWLALPQMKLIGSRPRRPGRSWERRRPRRRGSPIGELPSLASGGFYSSRNSTGVFTPSEKVLPLIRTRALLGILIPVSQFSKWQLMMLAKFEPPLES